jgi:hypothetical protein
MAMIVHPVDGLINRLLQQNNRPGKVNTGVSGREAFPRDHVQISGEAHQQARASENAPSRLENQLLQMYTRHGNAA